ncbi:MAG TPA: hypothetical protein DD491_01480 [Halieaceae bacterium]|nr:hypothetical protein [Halieaceae bacterium]
MRRRRGARRSPRRPAAARWRPRPRHCPGPRSAPRPRRHPRRGGCRPAPRRPAARRCRSGCARQSAAAASPSLWITLGADLLPRHRPGGTRNFPSCLPRQPIPDLILY